MNDSRRLQLQAIKELKLIQAQRPQPQPQPPDPQPAPQLTETESPGSPIGFVPQTTVMHSAPQAPPQPVSPENRFSGIEAP
jgi:hypothetical protein